MLPLSRVSQPLQARRQGPTRYTRYDRNDGVRIDHPQEVCIPWLEHLQNLRSARHQSAAHKPY